MRFTKSHLLYSDVDLPTLYLCLGVSIFCGDTQTSEPGLTLSNVPLWPMQGDCASADSLASLPAQATLSMDAQPGQKVGLLCKVAEDDEGTLLCALREGGTESQSLDLIFGARAPLQCSQGTSEGTCRRPGRGVHADRTWAQAASRASAVLACRPCAGPATWAGS